MIDYVRGTLQHIEAQYIVVDVQGVGYQIQCANPYHFEALGGKEVLIYTFQHVREDILALYGFSSREERRLFEKLLHVTGIGPKGALAIMASERPGQLIYAIQSEDVAFITKFPGIGKKTAQRMVVELKDKLDDLVPAFPTAFFAEEQKPRRSPARAVKSKELQEAREALAALGYTEKEIDGVTPQLQEDGKEEWSTDRYVKLGLQLLMKS